MTITVAGGGLAGAEAAWFLVNKGYTIHLYEMRPSKMTPAHVSEKLGELVCSNSLKSESLDTAAGLLKAELRKRGSLLLSVADRCRVPAGSALAVDRELFSSQVTKSLSEHPNIKIFREEFTKLPQDKPVIVACGPLASEAIINELMNFIGDKSLHFVDAISPVVATSSIDLSKGFFAGRYGKGGDDYLNLPMTEEHFDLFYDKLTTAETVNPHEFEDEKVFEKCMPIEVLAGRGKQTLLFGPMRPVGLECPVTGKRFHAVVQLRAENIDKTAYNIVGFQTKMTINSQKKVLSLIPGLENVEFWRFGAIHRNSYVNAPKCLNRDQTLKNQSNVYMAGQITGVEGYLESMASGVMAAIQMENKLKGLPVAEFHAETPFGALQRHIKGDFGDKNYTPSNFHFGMLPPPAEKIRKKADRKILYSSRALERLKDIIVNTESFFD